MHWNKELGVIFSKFFAKESQSFGTNFFHVFAHLLMYFNKFFKNEGVTVPLKKHKYPLDRVRSVCICYQKQRRLFV